MLAESLSRRLPGCSSLVASLMQHAIVGRVSEEGDEEQGVVMGGVQRKEEEDHSTQKPALPSKHALAAAHPPSVSTQPPHAASPFTTPSRPPRHTAPAHVPAPLVLRIHQPVASVTSLATRVALAGRRVA